MLWCVVWRVPVILILRLHVMKISDDPRGCSRSSAGACGGDGLDVCDLVEVWFADGGLSGVGEDLRVLEKSVW